SHRTRVMRSRRLHRDQITMLSCAGAPETGGPKPPSWTGRWVACPSSSIRTPERGSGNNYTSYTVSAEPARDRSDGRIRVYEEHLFSGIGKALGFQDVEVGDAAFDAADVVKADNRARRGLELAPRCGQELSAHAGVPRCVEALEGFGRRR